jgi:Nuclease-related domain
MERRIELLKGRSRDAPEGDPRDEASERTARLLSKLPERDWTVVSGVEGKHAVEHVLIGPGGVFAIHSRKPAGVGTARVKDGMLWLRSGSDARADRPGGAINREALESARALHKAIRARTGRGPVVQPVVVLWCDFPQAVSESDRIAFVRGRDLLAWIAHRPQRLDAPGRDEVSRAVASIPEARAARRWRGVGRRSA